MKLLHILIQGLLLALLVANAKSVRYCNGRSPAIDCGDPKFFDKYQELFCPRYYLADAIEANLKFIYKTAVKEKFSPSLNGETENFSAAVKSLIELHRIIKKFNSSDNQLEVAQTIATEVAKDSCKWLKDVGILTADADCDSSDSYLSQLEQVAARLDVLNAMEDSRRAIRSLPNLASFTNKVYYCAWLNNRILDNCQDPRNYNSTYREVLQPVCSGSCAYGPTNVTLCSV